MEDLHVWETGLFEATTRRLLSLRLFHPCEPSQTPPSPPPLSSAAPTLYPRHILETQITPAPWLVLARFALVFPCMVWSGWSCSMILPAFLTKRNERFFHGPRACLGLLHGFHCLCLLVPFFFNTAGIERRSDQDGGRRWLGKIEFSLCAVLGRSLA